VDGAAAAVPVVRGQRRRRACGSANASALCGVGEKYPNANAKPLFGWEKAADFKSFGLIQ